MKKDKVSIIGCGNIGTAIINGLLKRNVIHKENIIATKRNINGLDFLKATGIRLKSDNTEAVRESNVIVIAVKPYNFFAVLDEIKDHLDPRKHILVSVTAGIRIDQIRKIVPVKIPLFRAMPNISSSVGGSVSCICSDHAKPGEIENIRSFFNNLGETMMIDEELMDSATILGSCGIAFTLRYIRAMIQAGIQIGFDAKTASAIVNQTVKGAAELLIEEKQHPEFEIDKVTTPKGCTIVGLNEMEHNGFSSSLIKGIVASYDEIGNKNG